MISVYNNLRSYIMDGGVMSRYFEAHKRRIARLNVRYAHAQYTRRIFIQ